jgi:hypothetical protein
MKINKTVFFLSFFHTIHFHIEASVKIKDGYAQTPHGT